MRKNTLLIIGIMMMIMPTVYGQLRGAFHISSIGYIDFDVKYGSLNNEYTRVDLKNAYNKPLNAYNGNLRFTNPKTIGFDGKVGYFLNDKKTWGLSVGLIYFYQSGMFNLDTFHMEYSAVDKNKRPFRQIVGTRNLTESVGSNNISIPFMVHYQMKNAKLSFISVDAGILYNINMTSSYTASGNFNYEAIYKYDVKSKSFIFDNNQNIEQNGFIPITVAQYYSTNPKGTDLQGYFNELSQKWGANVALHQPIGNKTGTVSYKHGSIGMIVEPAVNYQISDLIFLKFGMYFVYQGFTTNGNGPKQMLAGNKLGDYNGLTNEISSYKTMSLGINAGIKIILKDNITESINFVTEY